MPNTHLVEQVLDIIASETGVGHDELYDDSEFSDLGIDTILSKLIVDRISETAGVILNPSIFHTCATVGSLKHHLATVVSLLSDPNISSNGSNTIRSVPPATDILAQQPSLVIRLQGNPRGARKNVFLLPDGSGTGMAYVRIPTLGPEICLYGLNSPFLKTGAGSFGRKLEDVAHLWIPEIRKVQPRGPYILGGWSAGGYYTFEVAKQLMREGDAVEKLVLIDSPCRLVFEALPMQVVDHLSANNLMGNWGAKDTPEWLIRHFDATIKSVDNYMPTPMEGAVMPEVFILWASEGVLPGEGAKKLGLDLSVKVTRFLVEGRSEFGPIGWEKLFLGSQISVAKMSGNHFTVVHEPHVSAGAIIAHTFICC
ncbi:hypothetical protein MMC20_002272 [Loxospora ochrophaea]|nr:hypothetical protein [Loxospora ochrophaea]